MRAVLIVIGVLNAASGALALIAPDTFFDQVGHYGVENSHYVGDVGAFVLAFGVAVLVAVRRPSWRVPVLGPRGALVRPPRAQPRLRRRPGAQRRTRDLRHRLHRDRRALCSPTWSGRHRGFRRPQGSGRRQGGVAMKVFVAGASGVIGRPLVRQLVAAGHEVTGVTSKAENAAAIEAAGATAAVCDALDAKAVETAVTDARPEVVISQLTRLPDEYNPRKIDYGPTNRARAEGGHNLIEAARGAGVQALHHPEHRLHLRAGGGDGQGRGSAGLDRCARALPRRRHRHARARARGDADAGDRGRGPALRPVLRSRHLLRRRRKHRRAGASAPLPDRRSRRGGCSPSSTSTTPPRRRSPSLERGAPGIYNVVDDEPAPLREWLPVYAEALGARRPLPGPDAVLARLVAGPFAAAFATELRGASNAKAKRELGWEPRYPSWRHGFREALG